jgi:hypothetical protein
MKETGARKQVELPLSHSMQLKPRRSLSVVLYTSEIPIRLRGHHTNKRTYLRSSKGGSLRSFLRRGLETKGNELESFLPGGLGVEVSGSRCCNVLSAT